MAYFDGFKFALLKEMLGSRSHARNVNDNFTTREILSLHSDAVDRLARHSFVSVI